MYTGVNSASKNEYQVFILG